MEVKLTSFFHSLSSRPKKTVINFSISFYDSFSLPCVGQKSYVCLQCYRSYEVPNQLKVHLARNCDQFEENVTWKRLQTELLSRRQRKLLIQSRNFEMMNPYHSAIMQSIPTSSRRFSAFQPVNKCENSPSPPAALMPIPNLSPISQSSLNDSALAAAAHLETIVSNMGTSKQGHLCIYCGKLYSRKYGLKIHIRTHTGEFCTCFLERQIKIVVRKKTSLSNKNLFFYHSHLGFKPLKCRHCFRAFGDPSNLNKHIRLHAQHNDHHTIPNNAAAYKCHLCSKVLMKRRDLQRHMQIKHSTTNGHHNSSLSSVDESSMTLLSPSSSSSGEETTE
jgi:PR domain zinc finger protein 13